MSCLIRVTKSNPCAVCRNDHACAMTDDGLHICLRTNGDGVPGFRYLGESRNGMGGLYRHEGDGRRPAEPTRDGKAGKPR